MIKNLIWDFDGTLFDTYPVLAKAYVSALKDYGIEEKESVLYQKMKISAKHTLLWIQEKYGLDDSFMNHVKKYKDEYDDGIHPYMDALDVMKEITDCGGMNFINTHRSMSAQFYCKKFNLDPYIKEYVTKENGFPRKPDPSSNQYLIEKYGLNKDETMIVGDRELDIECGIHSHIHTCYFDSDRVGAQTVAEYTITSLKELQEFIKKHP